MGDSQRIQVPAFVTAIVLIIMVIRDHTVGQIEYGWYHTIGKLFFFFACLGIGFYARYRVTGNAPRLMVSIVLVVFLNCAHSLAYEPAYHAGYNTTLLLALFIYNKSLRGFFAIMAVSLLILLVTLFVSGIQPNELYVQNWRSSVIMDHLVISMIILLIYQGIVKQMQEREFLYGQFLDIGRKTSMIVHDLKGGLSSPLLYAEIARERTSDPTIRELLLRLKEDLQFLSHYANELSEFTSKSIDAPKEFFTLSSMATSLATLAANEFSNILITLDGDYEVYLNKNLLRRALMNAFLNTSEEAMNLGRRLTISLKVVGDSIIVEDDGPGFSKDVLRKINRGQVVTTKKDGSGLGCRIISEYTKLLGGQAVFRNSPLTNGAIVELKFKDARIVKLSDQYREITDVPF